VARSSRPALASAGVAALLAASLAAAGPAAAARPSVTSHFATPSSIASIGPWIAVANRATSTLTVLAANGGAYVRTVGRPLLAVSSPTAIVAEPIRGRRTAFVAGTGGSVSELTFTAKGATVAVDRIRVLRPVGCAPSAKALLAIDARGHLVEACSNGVVVEWQASTGAAIRTIPAATTRLTDATGLAIIGAEAYLTNATSTAPGAAPDGVTELSLPTGARLRQVTNATSAAYGFAAPGGIATDGTHLWETNAAANTVDELAGGSLAFLGTTSTNLSDPGALVANPSFVWVSSQSWLGASSMVTQFNVVNHSVQSPWMMCNSNGPYQFDNPSGFAMHGGMLWVANASNDLIDQMDATTGALVGTYT
jgi:hypothetical protein